MTSTKCILIYYITLHCSSYMFRHISHNYQEEFQFSLIKTIKTIECIKIHEMEYLKSLTPVFIPSKQIEIRQSNATMYFGVKIKDYVKSNT
jgi:hypothetical protein